ncbi:hypothetical protein Shyhy02_43530 [Streptomyces hygroscopicus subsp. hygroscopicus]|nr:hypothetical protein Shyhy02_43530 [Streptomyces hygroscopicus subsp. hygroscopicus]
MAAVLKASHLKLCADRHRIEITARPWPNCPHCHGEGGPWTGGAFTHPAPAAPGLAGRSSVLTHRRTEAIEAARTTTRAAPAHVTTRRTCP